jgi:hypothetical protein
LQKYLSARLFRHASCSAAYGGKPVLAWGHFMQRHALWLAASTPGRIHTRHLCGSARAAHWARIDAPDLLN